MRLFQPTTDPLERFEQKMMIKGLSRCQIAQLAAFSVLWKREEFYKIPSLFAFCNLLERHWSECLELREGLLHLKPEDRSIESWLCDLQNRVCDFFEVEKHQETNRAITEICHYCYNLEIAYQIFDDFELCTQERFFVLQGISNFAEEITSRTVFEVLSKMRRAAGPYVQATSAINLNQK